MRLSFPPRDRGAGDRAPATASELVRLLSVGTTVHAGTTAGASRVRTVVAVDGDRVTLSPGTPDLGDVSSLDWNGPRGTHEVAVTVTGRDDDAGTVTVTAHGPVQTRQRRRHARAAALVPIRVTTDTEHLKALTCDVSESGLSFGYDGADPPQLGAAVRVTLDIDDVATMLSAVVRRSYVDGEGRRTVAVEFVDPGPAVEAGLRRLVLRWQTRARRVRQ